MKRTLMASILMMVLVVFCVPLANSEMAKEGTASITFYWSGIPKLLQIDETHIVMPYENTGVVVSDTGEGPFHNMSYHNGGIIYFENGVGKTLGYITMTDPQGDRVLIEIREDNAKMPPAIISGTGKILYGTGKFKGIEGTAEYNRYFLRPAIKDTYQAIAKGKISWKIVETEK